jgi:hypothetical protein
LIVVARIPCRAVTDLDNAPEIRQLQPSKPNQGTRRRQLRIAASIQQQQQRHIADHDS